MRYFILYADAWETCNTLNSNLLISEAYLLTYKIDVSKSSYSNMYVILSVPCTCKGLICIYFINLNII